LENEVQVNGQCDKGDEGNDEHFNLDVSRPLFSSTEPASQDDAKQRYEQSYERDV
jgi:hypothetical protein